MRKITDFIITAYGKFITILVVSSALYVIVYSWLLKNVSFITCFKAFVINYAAAFVLSLLAEAIHRQINPNKKREYTETYLLRIILTALVLYLLIPAVLLFLASMTSILPDSDIRNGDVFGKMIEEFKK